MTTMDAPAEDAREEGPPRGPLRIYAAFGVALAIVSLGADRLVRAREAASARDHVAAVAAAAAEPGTEVADPALPAGVLEIDLVPIDPDLEPTEKATLRAGGRRATWAPGAPARFEDLPADRRFPISIAGPYAADAASIVAPSGARGARIAVRAIPIHPPRRYQPVPGVSPEKRMELDLRSPDRPTVIWFQGFVVIAERDLVGTPAERAAVLSMEWAANASHVDVSDRNLDQAVVRAGPMASFDDIRRAVEALLSVRRPMYLGGERRMVSAFNVVVEPPFETTMP